MKIVVNNKQGYKIYRNYFGRWGLRGVPPGPEKEPMYFDFSNVESAGREVNITPMNNNINFEYSFDRVTWTSWVSGNNIVVDGHDKVWLRGSNNALGQSYSNLTKFNLVASDVNVAVGGNIMSLLYGSSFTGNETTFPTTGGHEFCGLFQDCEKLRDASKLILPALTINKGCYIYMFLGSSLVVTPTILPATTLADYCYQNMFAYCTSLTTVPILPATTLTPSCYNGMFERCEALTAAPELPATTLAGLCYNSMFQGCTALTQAPELPATTLPADCYGYMFCGCTNLNYIKCLTTNPSYGFTTNWVIGVAATGTFVKKAGVTWPSGVDGIPSGWTVVEE